MLFVQFVQLIKVKSALVSFASPATLLAFAFATEHCGQAFAIEQPIYVSLKEKILPLEKHQVKEVRNEGALVRSDPRKDVRVNFVLVLSKVLSIVNHLLQEKVELLERIVGHLSRPLCVVDDRRSLVLNLRNQLIPSFEHVIELPLHALAFVVAVAGLSVCLRYFLYSTVATPFRCLILLLHGRNGVFDFPLRVLGLLWSGLAHVHDRRGRRSGALLTTRRGWRVVEKVLQSTVEVSVAVVEGLDAVLLRKTHTFEIDKVVVVKVGGGLRLIIRRIFVLRLHHGTEVRKAIKS
mmetsp:Transcript_14487/g.26804  ORF Transcript_14487/g.26804 Transcript_14487/m.26804 type:complete len:293 (-) Transcript_14487:444-1322(-)